MGMQKIFLNMRPIIYMGIMQSIPPEDISNKEPLKPILGTPPDLLHPPKDVRLRQDVRML